jgi:hypothetical protein
MHACSNPNIRYSGLTVRLQGLQALLRKPQTSNEFLYPWAGTPQRVAKREEGKALLSRPITGPPMADSTPKALQPAPSSFPVSSLPSASWVHADGEALDVLAGKEKVQDADRLWRR